MILPSDMLVPTTWEVGWFRCPAPVLAEWLCAERLGGRPGDWTYRPVSAPTLAELCELVRAHPLEVDSTGRVTTKARHLLIPFPGWTAYLNDGPHGTAVEYYPSSAAARLGCRAIRAVASSRRLGGSGIRMLELYEPEGGGEPRRLIIAGSPTYPETNAERLPFEEPQEWLPGRRNRERFSRTMLERYLVELGVPVHDEPDTGSALLVEFAGERQEGPDPEEERFHRELFPDLVPERALVDGVTAEDALAFLGLCRELGTRIVGIESRSGADPWRDRGEGDPDFVYDLSAFDGTARRSADLAEERLREWWDGRWTIYGEAP